MSVPVDEDSGRVRSSVHVLGRVPSRVLRIVPTWTSVVSRVTLDGSRAKEAEDEVLYLIINVDDLLCPRPSPSRRWMDIAVPVHRKSRDPSSPTAVAMHGWGSFGS